MKQSSAVLIALAAAAGIGLAALLLLKRPGTTAYPRSALAAAQMPPVTITGDGNSVGNVYEKSTINNYSAAPPLTQKTPRLPYIGTPSTVTDPIYTP